MKLTLVTLTAAVTLAAGAGLQRARPSMDSPVQNTGKTGKSIFSAELIESSPVCGWPNHRTTWCKFSDVARIEKQQNIFRRLFPKTLEISGMFVSTMSFSSLDAASLMCGLARGKKPVTLLRHSTLASTKALRFLESDCEAFKSAGKLLKLGSLKPWRLQHTKLYLIDEPGPDTTIIVGSANVTRNSFTTIFDSWLKIRAPKNASFSLQHTCLKHALIAASESSSSAAANVFSREIRSCRTRQDLYSPEESLQKDGIAPLFSPLEDDRIEERLIEAIDKVPPGGGIMGVSQIFIDKNRADALRRAVSRGVKVRVLLDDDVLVGGDKAGQLALSFYRTALKDSGIELRFIETNADALQIMHHKFMVLNQNLVIAGSGQFTHAALNKNFENYYLISRTDLIRRYSDIFEGLWSKGFRDRT